MHFTCIVLSASHFHDFNSCRYFWRLTNRLGIAESRCCQINNFLSAFAVISNALKKLKEIICISRVFYKVAVIFMTLPTVDTFGGLKITLESLTLGVDN